MTGHGQQGSRDRSACPSSRQPLRHLGLRGVLTFSRRVFATGQRPLAGRGLVAALGQAEAVANIRKTNGPRELSALEAPAVSVPKAFRFEAAAGMPAAAWMLRRAHGYIAAVHRLGRLLSLHRLEELGPVHRLQSLGPVGCLDLLCWLFRLDRERRLGFLGLLGRVALLFPLRRVALLRFVSRLTFLGSGGRLWLLVAFGKVRLVWPRRRASALWAVRWAGTPSWARGPQRATTAGGGRGLLAGNAGRVRGRSLSRHEEVRH